MLVVRSTLFSVIVNKVIVSFVYVEYRMEIKMNKNAQPILQGEVLYHIHGKMIFISVAY